MEQPCWQIGADRGFLITPNPITTLRGVDTPLSTDITDHIEFLGDQVPILLDNGAYRATFDAMPVYDMRLLHHIDGQSGIIEHLMMRYGYFANGYIYADPHNPANRLPKSIAVPLVQLGQMVNRPPVLTYAMYVLANWRLQDPQGVITADNADIIQRYCGGDDEHWFILIHMNIEADAAGALTGLQSASESAKHDDLTGVINGLSQIPDSITAMMNTFNRMTEHCDPDVYYHHIRPYLFGLTNVIYEGVDEFAGKPQSYRGNSGAQSSIIPALVAGLGLQHEQSAMTAHLKIMHDYMPKPHRDFITRMEQDNIRPFVMRHRTHLELRDAYNGALLNLLQFRRLHLHFANTYVAQRGTNPIGTGGTTFMDWLKQLADETEKQFA